MWFQRKILPPPSEGYVLPPWTPHLPRTTRRDPLGAGEPQSNGARFSSVTSHSRRTPRHVLPEHRPTVASTAGRAPRGAPNRAGAPWSSQQLFPGTPPSAPARWSSSVPRVIMLSPNVICQGICCLQRTGTSLAFGTRWVESFSRSPRKGLRSQNSDLFQARLTKAASAQ